MWALCGMLAAVSAQRLTIKGVVEEQVTGARMEGVNVRLLAADSVFVQGCATDTRGEFELEGVAPGDWLLIFSMVGYEESTLRLEGLHGDADVDVVWMAEMSTSLGEVVVEAQRSTRDAGRLIVFPSSLERESSFSAFEMLEKMRLPGLDVNSTQNSIRSIRNGEVQIRVNGVESTLEDALAIVPSRVVKVEYIDMPGARYGEGVVAVVNFVTRRATEGFSGGTTWKNAATTGYGNDNFYLKYNNKASEFTLNYDLSYRKYDDKRTDVSQTFLLADGSTRSMEKLGLESPYREQTHNLSLSYNLNQPEKSILNVKLSNSWQRKPYYQTIQLIRETGQPDLTAHMGIRDMTLKPTLDIYYERQLPADQTLQANVVGTYISSDYTRDYAEYLPDQSLAGDPLDYTVDGDKYSVIGEFIYAKQFKNSTRWNSGLRYNYSYLENHYLGSTGDVTPSMDNSDLYLFTELEGSIRKFSYNVGVGFSRQHFKEGEHEFNYYSFRPTVSLSYAFTPSLNLAYQFQLRPQVPQLADISDVDQWQNPYEVRVGNPDLKPFRVYVNNLSLGYDVGPFNFYLSGYYQRNQNGISSDAVRRVDTGDSYHFEYRVANQKSFNHIQGLLYVTYAAIRDVLKFSAIGGVNHYINKGNDYESTYTGGYLSASVDAMYKGFALNASYRIKSTSNLGGETKEHYAESADVNLSYRFRNNLRVGIGLMNPFFKDGEVSGSVLDSEVLRKETWNYTSDLKNTFYVTFAWNFSIGKKHTAGAVRLNNGDYDSGVIK